MDQLKQRRTPLRASFTKTANSLEEVIATENPDLDYLRGLLAQLEEKGQKLSELDGQIIELLQQTDGCSQGQVNAEFEGSEVYSDRLVLLKMKTRCLLARQGNDGSERSSVSETPKRKYKLPQIELKKFGGDAKDWIGFWGQFRKIDEDPDLDAEDKYQYLLQSTVVGSRARDLVESFPPTASNYPKAIECLRNRFGRDETLVEVYVRELLRLVLHNVTVTPNQRGPLSVLYDKLETQLRALDVLGVAKEKYAAMLFPLVESCLPEEVLRAWERNRCLIAETNINEGINATDSGNYLNLLMKFLKNEVDGEERIKMACAGLGLRTVDAQGKPRVAKQAQLQGTESPTAAGLFSGTPEQLIPNSCMFCKNQHDTRSCRKAFQMPFDEKRKILVKEGCCFACLRKGHTARNCKRKPRCVICNKNHFEVMCPERSKAENDGQLSGVKKPENKPVKEQSLTNATCTSNVCLQTLLVRARGRGKEQVARVLIDTGSQRSYITENLMREMGYETVREEIMTHCLFGGEEKIRQTHRCCRVRLSSLDGQYHCNFEAQSQPTICARIPKVKEGPWVNELKEKGIYLSDFEGPVKSGDPCFESEEIHILVGADISGKLFTGQVEHLNSGPVAFETNLGWTLMGKISEDDDRQGSSMAVLDLFVRDSKIADLWSLDVIGFRDPVEERCIEELNAETMRLFLETVERNAEGRYEVCLPWIKDHVPLPSNPEIAEKRLRGTVRKLKATNQLQAYQSILDEWQAEGIIEDVPREEQAVFGHYLPHRAVFNEKSCTTKIRPVFDASARQKDSPSLNDCLQTGPNLVELISAVLNKFRLNKIGVVADIKRAFLQISVSSSDRDFLRFLWWEKGDENNLRVFRHRRVVFGVSSSPFLLGATLNYHLNQAPDNLRETVSILKESFYVDNLVASVNDEAELEKVKRESQELLSSAKFDLRGWKNTSTSTEPNDEIVPVLGLLWNLEDDTLTCDISAIELEAEEPVTKRIILATVHKVFDPIGVTSPVTLLPKLQLQECWHLGVTWDMEVTPCIAKKFAAWKGHLTYLNQLRVPRYVGGNIRSGEPSLHVFCDASQYAYATCIFLRLETHTGITCQLIQAKTRVAPLKTVTIPRLELMACCIGARLSRNVKQDLQIADIPTYCWTDSANVLYWLQREGIWGVFVNNRVKEIRTLTVADNWRHIAGKLNPADLPSRGCTAKTLLESRWWEGPSWLKLPKSDWPISHSTPDHDVIDREKGKTTITTVAADQTKRWYNTRFSSFPKTVRVVAWVKRFCNNAKREKASRSYDGLSSEEVNEAELLLWRWVQGDVFKGETDGKIRDLKPIKDKNELLRARTRISMRTDSEYFRYPILLPSNNPVVEQLIRHKHISLGHAGVQHLMSELRERYWILKSRMTIKQVVQHCVKCKRHSGRPIEVISGPLPQDRVKDAAVFEVSGVDLAGPLILKGGQKSWIVLFTCAVYRAVHLELVSSLSTESFLQALRRFIARRGRPHTLYSDNGLNFVGANNALRKVDWETLKSLTTMENIHWKFIPPASPWWGGWWERLIGLVKQTLRRILGCASLTYEEMVTVLCDSERYINARPLSYVSEDINDLVPLTPAMFLHEIKEDGVPDIDIVDDRELQRRSRYRQRVMVDLRARFRKEYLGQLREHSNSKTNRKVSIGDIVFLVSENVKRIQWPLARVTQVFPGKDGKIRVVRVKTTTGEYLRPIQKLIPMEVSSKEEQIRSRRCPPYEPKESAKNTKEENSGSNHRVITTKGGRIVKRPNRLTYPA